jgi:hypothetical protein
MNFFTNKTVLAIAASLMLVAFSALPVAAQSNLILGAPGSDPALVPNNDLPRFGFASYNIGGVGERVTFVRWGGLASRLGLEPGDIILRMNDVRLTYRGSWNDALRHALEEHDGLVRLRIRDVRTGLVATRQIFVGGGFGDGGGPISHYSAGGNAGSGHSHVHRNEATRPGGPGRDGSTRETLREIGRLMN